MNYGGADMLLGEMRDRMAAKDAEIASLRAQNELTHVAYVEENNRLMAEREALREALSTAKRELNDAEEARNDAETRLLANLTAAHQDAEEIARLTAVLTNIVAHFDMAAELYISDSDLAGGLADIARAALACRPQGATVDDVPSCGSENDYRNACRPQGERSEK